MTPTPGPQRPLPMVELVAASLITHDDDAEVQLVARDGRRLRVATDAATARALALTLWSALDAPAPSGRQG